MANGVSTAEEDVAEAASTGDEAVGRGHVHGSTADETVANGASTAEEAVVEAACTVDKAVAETPLTVEGVLRVHAPSPRACSCRH